jgi:septin 3/9/12
MRDRFIPDTRIHCCVFFINPTGHTLAPVSLRRSIRDIYMLAALIRSLDRYRGLEEARRGRQRRSHHRQIRLVDA